MEYLSHTGANLSAEGWGNYGLGYWLARNQLHQRLDMATSVLIAMQNSDLLTKAVGDKKKRWSVIIVVIGAATLGLLLSLLFPLFYLFHMSYAERVSGPIADKKQHDLEIEFQKILPLAQAVPVQHNSMHKISQGHINTAYKTGLNFNEIKSYYSNELASKGWKFVREAQVVYGEDGYGGRELFYCKGDYVAHLYYAGQQEREFGWTYSFALTWGLYDECR